MFGHKGIWLERVEEVFEIVWIKCELDDHIDEYYRFKWQYYNTDRVTFSSEFHEDNWATHKVS